MSTILHTLYALFVIICLAFMGVMIYHITGQDNPFVTAMGITFSTALLGMLVMAEAFRRQIVDGILRMQQARDRNALWERHGDKLAESIREQREYTERMDREDRQRRQQSDREWQAFMRALTERSQ